MKFKFDASGTDIIPNKTFWFSLPGLIKVQKIDSLTFKCHKIHINLIQKNYLCFVLSLAGWLSVYCKPLCWCCKASAGIRGGKKLKMYFIFFVVVCVSVNNNNVAFGDEYSRS